MKNRLLIIAMLSVAAIVATAQTYKTGLTEKTAMQSQQVMMTGHAYNGTVYEPFSSTTPSEQNAPQAKVGPRRVEGIGGGDGGNGSGLLNPGEGDPNSPLGDAVLPLLLMALGYVGYMSLKKKQAQKA